MAENMPIYSYSLAVSYASAELKVNFPWTSCDWSSGSMGCHVDADDDDDDDGDGFLNIWFLT
jgi:hypothetical protein